jgi:hypothetical protein
LFAAALLVRDFGSESEVEQGGLLGLFALVGHDVHEIRDDSLTVLGLTNASGVRDTMVRAMVQLLLMVRTGDAGGCGVGGILTEVVIVAWVVHHTV